MSSSSNEFATTVQSAVALFREAFGASPELAATAPGRVNLIGEHTDYCDGFVFPMALDKSTVVVGRATPSGTLCRVVTNTQDDKQGIAQKTVIEFEVARASLVQGEPSWCNYVKGVLAQFETAVPAFEIAIATSVPIGGGLSSSAALEVATHTFLELLLGQKVENSPAKAKRCQKAEHDFANMPCGIMDQFIATLGQAGHALLIDCRSFEARLVPLSDPNVVVFVANSNVSHKLSDSEYPKRRAECARAVAALDAKFGIKSLRDATPGDLEQVKDTLDSVAFARARHVIGETLRCEQASACFTAGDYAGFGKLMVASHESLRDDYQVSCTELDKLVALSLEVDGVFGARMTGGGFGGCTVTLAKASCTAELQAHVLKGYPNATCFFTRPGDGAKAVDLAAFL